MSLLPRELRARRDRQAALLVLAAMVVFVAVIYVVVVLGGGLLIGQTETPNVVLSILATAVVALGFEPVQARAEAAALRHIRGDRPSAFDVLSRFTDEVSGAHSDEALPERIARVLRNGTGATWAQVWLIVNGRPVLAGACPGGPEASDHTPPEADEPTGRSRLDVRHGGERLAILRLQEPDDQQLTAIEERLFTGLAAQSGLLLRSVALRAELADRLADLSARADDLIQSRQRLIDTQDTERRRLERDIHDGAQQHLVALAVNLRLAQTLAARSPDRAQQVLDEQLDATRLAISTLTDLARGIYPRVLADQGVGEALRVASATSPIPVHVRDAGLGRLPEDLEEGVYFCALEAIQNAVKHAHAHNVDVVLQRRGTVFEVDITDDGAGFDAERVAGGTGLAGMRDRIDAVGGRLNITATSAGGTRVHVVVPVPDEVPAQTELGVV